MAVILALAGMMIGPLAQSGSAAPDAHSAAKCHKVSNTSKRVKSTYTQNT